MAPQRYTQVQVEKAVELVRSNEMSLLGASRAFRIPYATLGDKVRGRRPMKAGPRTVLSSEEEAHLIKLMNELSNQGFECTKDDLKDMVKAILDERGAKTIFTNNRPGKDWTRAFFKRHPQVRQKIAKPRGQKKAVDTKDGLTAWFENMKLFIDDIDPTLLSSPGRIFTTSESGFHICPKTKKVLSMGTKHVHSVTSGTRQQVTIVACCSAIGQYIPPLLIFPYTRDPRFNPLEGFEDAFFQKTPNGLITEEVFFTFLRDVFIPNLNSMRPVVLFVEDHSSHHSIAINTLCEENGIILYCLKANASHFIQPLDQAFWGAVKSAWNEALRKYQCVTGERVTVRTFASTMKKVWDNAARVDIASEGFGKSGIFPFSPETVLGSDCGKLKPTCSFTSMAAASESDKSLIVPSSGQPEELCSSSICSQPLTSTSPSPSVSILSASTSPKPTAAVSNLSASNSPKQTASVSNLFKLMEFNFSLGEETVMKYMKQYEEQCDVVDPSFIEWKSLVDKVSQPAASAHQIPSSPSASVYLTQRKTKSKTFDDLLTVPKRKGVKKASAAIPFSLRVQYIQTGQQQKIKREERDEEEIKQPEERETEMTVA